MILLQNSLSATVLILAVWMLRRVALNRLPKNTFCLLWICAALRLVLPYSIPSRFSIYTLVFNLLMPQPTSFEVPVYQMMAPVTPKPQVTPLTVVWLAGILAMAAVFLISYIRSMVIFRGAVPVEALPVSAPNFHRHVQVKTSGRVAGPLTYGVFRPVILLPEATDWENTEALSFILAHEYAHIRRWDCLTKLLMTTALCLHWFNPAVWLLCRFAGRDMELACDEMAIRTLGEESRFSYARALTEQCSRTRGIFLPASTFGGAKIRERVNAILKSRRCSWVTLVLSALLVMVTLAVFATGAKLPDYQMPAKMETQPDYSDWASACPDGARLYYVESEVMEQDPAADPQRHTPDVLVEVRWVFDNGSMPGSGFLTECTPDGCIILPPGSAPIPMSEFSTTRFQTDKEFIESFSPEYRQAASDFLRFFAEHCAETYSDPALPGLSIFTMLTTTGYEGTTE